MRCLPPFLLAACLASPALADPLRVLGTVGMVSDIARQVGGACVAVDTLIAPGVDPHYFSATPADVRAIEQADLVVYVDRALEERLADVLDRFADRRPVLGVVAATFDAADLLTDPEDPTIPDPHVWMDASLWARIATPLADTMGALRPDCAADMTARAAQLKTRLDALHDWTRATIATIPDGQRLLVTAHDAFAYFARAYGIEASEAVSGLSTLSEASIADIRDVARFVSERGVPAVFVETTVNPRTIEALVAEARSLGHDLSIGGELFSDAMGDDGTPEGSYIGMMRANAATIALALGGSLPEWPDALADWAREWTLTE